MRKIVPTEITRIEATAENTFFDECTVDAYSETYDSYGDILKSWIPGSGIECGFQALNGTETIRGEIVVTNLDAKIRLPIDTVISSQDRITINKRNGVVISGIQYGVENISRGVSCLLCNCTVLEV